MNYTEKVKQYLDFCHATKIKFDYKIEIYKRFIELTSFAWYGSDIEQSEFRKILAEYMPKSSENKTTDIELLCFFYENSVQYNAKLNFNLILTIFEHYFNAFNNDFSYKERLLNQLRYKITQESNNISDEKSEVKRVKKVRAKNAPIQETPEITPEIAPQITHETEQKPTIQLYEVNGCKGCDKAKQVLNLL